MVLKVVVMMDIYEWRENECSDILVGLIIKPDLGNSF